jgi:hypothetical protein
MHKGLKLVIIFQGIQKKRRREKARRAREKMGGAKKQVM